MSSMAIDQILIQLEGIHHIEKCDDEGNTDSYSKETKNFFKIIDEYPNRYLSDDAPSRISIKYNICPRCKNQIKPGERRLYASVTKTHSKLHKYEFQYGIDEYYRSPAEITEINCFHFECLDKSIIDTNDGRKAITCAHCFLPLSRSKLIDELNLSSKFLFIDELVNNCGSNPNSNFFLYFFRVFFRENFGISIIL